ncbi:FAD/NAD(P)-binding domain-containing protein [Obba rivulosa]|uniref:FAD/NAD(P)-binding domain-containing protein n=1 Tax=Obba rivulosa TaxID=1052685 RepID=A0A8E2DLJ0_9APHY|nr:FAD/NAD(P)-binding domain-containing protein [Obba rivulosa]
MVYIGLLVLSLLPFSVGRQEPLGSALVSDQYAVTATPAGATKSIAIVGAGSGGLAALKTILDLPKDVREGWEIELYEQRRDVGGVWLADPPGKLPDPPELPETPLYPLLHTNTPHPTMTYPHFTFRPGTPLFPSHEYLWQYHVDYADHFNLWPHIHLNHVVSSAAWRGDNATGEWEVEIHAQVTGGCQNETRAFKKTFDHLIVANGHNHYPYIPAWNGTDEWLGNTPPGFPEREILHSIYYRHPEKYTNRSVIIVGAGASARDAVLQVGPLARTAYQSLSEGSEPPPEAQVITKPRISHFTKEAVVFIDGTSLDDVDSLILGTGYEFRVPFLSVPRSNVLVTDPDTPYNSTTAPALTSNLRYIFPLHRQIFNLAPTLPTTALAFVGLPVLIANAPSDAAQGLLIAHALANTSLLPPRDEMLRELVAHEDLLRLKGLDPYRVGHRLLGGDTEAQDYQDDLIDYVKKHGAIPDDGQKYVEQWRRTGRTLSRLLARAWKRVEDRGEEARWLDGVETEDEWAQLMYRLAEWQEEWEKEHGESANPYA